MVTSPAPASPSPGPRRRWQKLFLAMLPAIIRHAKIAFRHIRCPDTRQDKIQETVANALVAFRRLVQLNKTDIAYPSVLAKIRGGPDQGWSARGRQDELQGCQF